MVEQHCLEVHLVGLLNTYIYEAWKYEHKVWHFIWIMQQNSTCTLELQCWGNKLHTRSERVAWTPQWSAQHQGSEGSQCASHAVSPSHQNRPWKVTTMALKCVNTDNWGSHTQENILSHFGVWSKNKEMNREDQEDYKGQIWVSHYHSCKCQDYGHLRCVLCPEGGQTGSHQLHCTSNYSITRALTYNLTSHTPPLMGSSFIHSFLAFDDQTNRTTYLHLSPVFGILLWRTSHWARAYNLTSHTPPLMGSSFIHS